MNETRLRELLDIAYDFKVNDTTTLTRASYEKWRDEALALLPPEGETREKEDAFPFNIQSWKPGDRFDPEKMYLLTGAAILTTIAGRYGSELRAQLAAEPAPSFALTPTQRPANSCAHVWQCAVCGAGWIQQDAPSSEKALREAHSALKSLLDAHKRLGAGFGLPYEEDKAREEYVERIIEDIEALLSSPAVAQDKSASEELRIAPLDMIGTLPDKVHEDLPGGHCVKAVKSAPEAPKEERHITLHVEVIKGIPMIPLAEAEEYAKFKVESKRSAMT